MSFLATQGICDQGIEFKEVIRDAERADVRIYTGAVKRLYWVIVISNSIDGSEEGFNQLFAYMVNKITVHFLHYLRPRLWEVGYDFC